MRRSAAPSQNTQISGKRFCPPFAVKNSDTPLVFVPKVSNNKSSADSGIFCGPVDVVSSKNILATIALPTISQAYSDTKVRSSAEILSLLNKSKSSDRNKITSPDRCSLENFPSKVSPNMTDNISNTVLPHVTPLIEKNCNVLSQTQSHLLGQTHFASQHKAENACIKSDEVRYFSAVWCKLSKKKHKNWEGDAVVIVKGRSVILKDMEGKEIGQGCGYKLKDLTTLEEGNTLVVGGKEIEIQGVISAMLYETGQCFHSHLPVSTTPDESVTASMSPPKPKPFCKPFRRDGVETPAIPLKRKSEPLFSPSQPGALVMPRPPVEHQWAHNKESHPLVDVVVDPRVSAQLRPHQRAGVVFLYQCLMGFRDVAHRGVILADEMGLGKTLQCITVVWTLLKQGPYGCQPIVNNVLIVTPSSLIENWGKEFHKWLGNLHISIYLVDQTNRVENFERQRTAKVMIISYEMFLRCYDVVNKIKFDLMLCDEGHRLKNTTIKTTSLLTSLDCQLRVLLTGTPVQNDLQELFALMEFVNPGMLGTAASFRRIYEEPICAAQQPNSSVEVKELAESRSGELNRLTSMVLLRRTQDIINRYLPPKVETVVFCQPSETQLNLYGRLVSCRGLRECLNEVGNTGAHLSAILALRKLCNHPALLSKVEEKEVSNLISQEALNIIPQHQPGNVSEEDSGKLAVVSSFLRCISEAKQEKIVLVSNFTTALDMLAALCSHYGYAYLRLDGSTPQSKRQGLVDQFNSKHSPQFVFLLSSKAGGMGLNLIGASRILLFDIDWNPATDLQAMARVWRDGQTRTVFIYRLLLTGSIEEKMYQRQIRKQGLSGTVVDARDSSRVSFSTEELKDLFTFHPDTMCQTHDLLQCTCDLMGGPSMAVTIPEASQQRECQLHNSSKEMSGLKQCQTTMDQLFRWQHFSAPLPADAIRDSCLEAASEYITFVLRNETEVDIFT